VVSRRFIAFDYKRVRADHAMFAELAKHDDVTIFSAHDPVEYERLLTASDERTLSPSDKKQPGGHLNRLV
jgi:hypothetical protein